LSQQKGVAKGQNIRTLNPALKTLTAFNEKRMKKLYGRDSPQAKSAKELLKNMLFGEYGQATKQKYTDASLHFADKAWDKRLFGPLGLQRKMARMHVDPADGLIREEDNQKFIAFLKEQLLKLGAKAKHFDSLKHCDKLVVYTHLCDCASSLLLVYSTVRKAEVEGITKLGWANSVQREPVNCKYFNTGNFCILIVGLFCS
jgi:hypothetical protein